MPEGVSEDSPFVGQFEHSLDAKGRMVLPAGFRPAFELAGFLIKSSEGCLALLTPKRFRDIAAGMAERSAAGGVSQRAAKRSFGAGAARVVPDKQGRFAIPEELRRFAHLSKDCVVIGAIDEIEIWDAGRWEQINAAGEKALESPEAVEPDVVEPDAAAKAAAPQAGSKP